VCKCGKSYYNTGFVTNTVQNNSVKFPVTLMVLLKPGDIDVIYYLIILALIFESEI
jgi:hypothetical protein